MLKRFFYLFFSLFLGFFVFYFLNKITKTDVQNSPASAEITLYQQSFADADGKPYSLAQGKSKVMVLNFWATWCEPCREEMPDLSQLQTEFKAKDVVFIGVGIDGQAVVKEYLEKHTSTYPLLVGESNGMALAETLGNNKGMLPFTVIVGKDGQVVTSYLGRIDKAVVTAKLNKITQP